MSEKNLILRSLLIGIFILTAYGVLASSLTEQKAVVMIADVISGGAAFYYLLYKTRAVPRFISVWGGAAIFVLLVKTVFNLAGIKSQVLDMFLVLIITNEVFLALWLMIKGLKLQTAEAA